MILTNNPYCKQKAELIQAVEQAEPGSVKQQKLQERLTKITALSESYLVHFDKKGKGAQTWKPQRQLNAFIGSSN